MKKIYFAIVILFLLIPSVLADGFIHIYDKDMWNLFNEEQQFCAINYKNGLQNMILTVDTSEELRGEKAVWIFPVPAKPEKTVINIIKGFPTLLGYDVQEKADDSVSEIFMVIRATQIYPLPILLFGRAGFGAFERLAAEEGVTVHERIEKMGLTTELVSAVDAISLSNYLTGKGLVLEDASRSILDEYIGQEYSFVISWISDIEKFKQEQGRIERGYGGMWTGSSIGVFITFPTDKIYYPLKPTSVYGSKKVPVVIYVTDYVEPELYSEIKADSEVNYFFQRSLTAPDDLIDFFAGYEKETAAYWTPDGTRPGFIIKDLKYTKIKINSFSKYLTQDLWMEISTPFKVKVADFANRFGLWYGLVIFIVCSCLASLISGVVIFRKVSKLKLTLFGLWNFLTLIGFSIAAYVSKIDKTREKVNLEKFVTRTLLFALILPLLLLFFMLRFVRYWGIEMVVPFIVIYPFACLFLAPFVWGYYSNRKIMKFTILFTVLFVILTIIAQLLLMTLI